MARNRQRSKQRQQERREARLAQRRAQAGGADDGRDREELLREADLEVGAPPQDLGRSDETLAHSPLREGDEEDLDELDEVEDEELEDYDYEDEEQPLDDSEPARAGPRGVRGGRTEVAGAPTERGRGRLVSFLIAVWAELKRVQWPDRKQLTQMTGIVLFFVLIAGSYLGLLDAIFSRLIKQIL